MLHYPGSTYISINYFNRYVYCLHTMDGPKESDTQTDKLKVSKVSSWIQFVC